MSKFSKKTLFVGSGLSLAGILATSLAFAAFKHGHHHDGYHAHKGGKHGGMMRLHKLDQDNDDAVSLSEFQAPSLKSFETLDANQDGTISSEEFLAKTTARFAKFDVDESGIIEASEFPKRHKDRKDRKDRKGYSDS